MADATIVVEVVGEIAKLKQALSEVEGSTQKTFQSMGNLGKTLSLSVTAPLTAMGTAAIKASMDFNSAMANVSALIPESAGRIEELKGAVQALAQETGVSTNELAKGLYEVISALGDSADAVQQLEIVTKTARAGVADIADTLRMLSTVMKSYGDTSAEAMQKVSDFALMTVKLGQTTLPELADALGRVAPIASSLGISLEELHTVFATLTGVTGDAAEVATQFRAILSEMLKPGKELSEVLAELGYDSGQKFVEAMGGVVPALQKLYEYTGQNAEAFTQLFGRIEGINASLALVGPQAEVFNTKLQQMAESAGFTEKAFEAQTQGINAAGFTWEQFRAKLQVFMEQVGDKLLPVLSRLLDSLSGLFDWFSKLPDGVQNFLMILAGGAAAGGPVMMMVGAIGQATTAFSSLGSLFAAGGMLGPAGLVAVGVVAVTALIITHWDDVKGFLLKCWEGIKSAAETIWGGIKGFFSRVWEGIKETHEAYMEGLRTGLSTVWEKTKSTAQTIWGGIKGFFIKVWEGVNEYHEQQTQQTARILMTSWETIKKGAEVIWGGMKSFFSNFWSGLKETWQNNWNALSSFLSSTWESISEKASETWDKIKSGAKGLWDKLVGHSIIPDMVDKINQEFQRIDESIVIDKFATLHAEVEGKALAIAEATLTVGESFANLRLTAETELGTAVESVKTNMSELLGVVGGIGNIAIGAQFGEQPTIGQVGGIFTGILGLFASIPGIIVNFFSMLFGWLERYQQKIKEMVDSVLEYMESGIKAFFSAPTIYDAITGFGENLRKVVYQMLVDAITQAIIASEAVRDAAKELGKTINEAIKEATATGIFDPQTFLNIAGPAIQAYAQFWQQTMLPVLQQAYAYLQPYNPAYAGGYETVSGTFPSYQSGGYVRTTGLALLHEGEYVVPRGGVAFGNVSIAINVQNGDPRRIAREIWDELEYEARRRGIALAR